MIGWSAIGAELQAIFSEIATKRPDPGGAPFQAAWVDGRRPWQDGKRFTITDERGFSVGLTVTSVSGIGQDETRETLSDENELIETATGQRKFTLQMQALAIAGGVNEDFAMALTERTRTRLTSRRIVDRLLEIDVDVISCGPSVFLGHRDGQRMLTSATMDVVFGCTASEDDPIPAGWIQYLVISSHVKDLDDATLGTAQQMVNVEVPPIPVP